MAAIVKDTEKDGLYRVPELDRKPRTRGGAITRAAVNIADQLDAKLIVTFTQSGDSARRLARLRPETPIVAFTTSSKVRSFLSMLWGVDAEQVEMITNQEDMFHYVDEYLLENGLAKLATWSSLLLVLLQATQVPPTWCRYTASPVLRGVRTCVLTRRTRVKR